MLIKPLNELNSKEIEDLATLDLTFLVPVIMTVTEPNRKLIIDLMLRHGIHPDSILYESGTFQTIVSGDDSGYVSTVRQLLEAGASPNGLIASGRPILLSFVVRRLNRSVIAIAKLLLEFGADPNCKFSSETPLWVLTETLMNFYVSDEYFSEACELFTMLIEKGADINFIHASTHILIFVARNHCSRSHVCQILLAKILSVISDPNLVSDGLFAVFSCYCNYHLTNDTSSVLFHYTAQGILEPYFNRERDFQRNQTRLTGGQIYMIKDALEMFLNHRSWNTEMLDRTNDMEISILGFLALISKCSNTILQDEIHDLLIRGADPNVGEVLPLVEIAKMNEDNYSDPDPRTTVIQLLIDYGANPNLMDRTGKFFWNYVTASLLKVIDTIHETKARQLNYKLVLQEIRKTHYPRMYHPDRLGVRLHNIQNKLTSECYDQWRDEESGWLEYLGIYDYQSFRDKIPDYVRFMD